MLMYLFLLFEAFFFHMMLIVFGHCLFFSAGQRHVFEVRSSAALAAGGGVSPVAAADSPRTAARLASQLAGRPPATLISLKLEFSRVLLSNLI